MLTNLQNQLLQKRFSSMELEGTSEMRKEITSGIPRTNSLNMLPSSQYSTNSVQTPKNYVFENRQPLMESQTSNLRHLPSIKSSPSLNSPLLTSTPQENGRKKASSPLPPINTTRLQPTKHRSKNLILSILESGDVIVETLKYKAQYEDHFVVEVIRISKNGHTIQHYTPNNGQGVAVKDDPPANTQNCYCTEYTYDNLRQDYWKKYTYAAKFVQMVRAKTLKITYYSQLCKFQVMESLADFDAFFYTGLRITKSGIDGVKLVDANGQTHFNSIEQICESRFHDLWEHFTECIDHCMGLDLALSRLESTGICFPIVIGRKPIISSLAKQASSIHSAPKQNSYPPLITTMDLYSTPQTSRPPSRGCPTPLPSNYVQKNVVTRLVTVPGIGTASQLTHGVIQVSYQDGSKLSVIPEDQGGGVTYAEYGGINKHYSDKDELPKVIRDKLEQIPLIIKHLKNSAPVNAVQKSSSLRYLR